MDRHRHHLEIGKGARAGGRSRRRRPRRRASRRGRPAARCPARSTSARTAEHLGESPDCAHAVDDRIGRAQHAEQRPAATAVVGRTLDEPGDLDQLHQHAADARQRRHRPQRRERVVAGLDLDLRQRLQERRLAHVGRPHKGDLGRPFAAHRDRVAMHGAAPGRACPRSHRRATCAGPRTARCGNRAAPRAARAPPGSVPCLPCPSAGASPPGRRFDAASA